MIKKILAAALFVPLVALAQTYPSPTFNSLTLQNPLTAANGGTGSSTATGSGSVVLSTSPTIANPTVTGSFTATGLVTIADLAAQASNTVTANVTGSSASPTAFAMPSCSSANSALQYTSGTGFNCVTTTALTTGTLAQFASTTSAQLAGIVSDETGSGSLVFAGSPALTGTPTAPTASTGTNTTQVATTAFVKASVGAQTQYNVALGNGAGSLTYVAPGSSGTLLGSTGASSNPSFQTPLSLGLVYDGTVANVLNYGAVGNSNGTHGNGTDSTTAFQNAMNAATGGTLFIPCGTYRLTSTITTTDGKPRYVYGHGTCTKIFNDAATAQPTFSFSPTSGTCSSAQLAPCLVVQGLNFLPPNVTGGAQAALSLTNTNAPLVTSNTFSGQNVGVALTTSFAPRVITNQFISGAYGVFTSDISANGAEIASNGFYGMSADAIYIAPASGCAESPSIRNNDMEDNAAAVLFGGVCGGSFANNYEENLHTQVPFVFTGTTNAALSFTGNTINSSDTTPVSVPIAHVAGAVFSGNAILNTTFSYGTGATLTRLRSVENTLSTTTLAATTVACTGLGTGGTCAVTGDDFSGSVALNTGSASTSASGTVTLTFTNAIGATGSSCTWTPVAGTANWSSASFLISSTATTSNQVTWTNSTNLTQSKVYQLGYTCQGY